MRSTRAVMHSWTTGVLAVVLSAAAITGCTSTSTSLPTAQSSATSPTPTSQSPAGLSSAATTGTAATGTTATSTTAGPTLVQNPLPSKVLNQPAVRKDVVTSGCASVPGGWGATGTVTNSSAKERTYKIVVYFTTTHATALDYAQASVTVAPAKTQKWNASKKFDAQQQMYCVLAGISA